MDREARAAEILAEARRTRRPTPRWLWSLAIAMTVVCVGGLAIAWIEDRGARPAPRPHAAAAVQAAGGGGLGIGLVIGIAVGVVLGLALGMRRGARQ